MDRFWNETVWNQYGAAIESLERAIDACPDERWSEATQPPFWYLVYHTLFWLDFYLDEEGSEFRPQAPYGLEEMDPAGVMPPRVYTRAEMKAYLEHGYAKCRARIAAMSPAEARSIRRLLSGNREITEAELLLYSMRHVQHHTAQLNLLLRRSIDSAPGWVFRAGLVLEDA